MKWIRQWLKKFNAQAPAPARAPHAQAANQVQAAKPVPEQAPRGEDSPEVWRAAICQARDKALALSWLAGVQDEAGLCEVATRAHIAEVRFAAVQRIATDALLEQVAQASRDKDKRVYRHCADLLRQRRQADTNRRRAQEIADQLHALLATAPLPLSRLRELKDQMSLLGDAGEPGLACIALMQQAQARLQQEAEIQRDVQAQQRAAMTLAAECAEPAWPSSEQRADWHARCATLRQAQVALPDWLAGASARLSEVLGEIETRLAALAADAARVEVCEQFLATQESAGRECTTPENAASASAEVMANDVAVNDEAATDVVVTVVAATDVAADWQALSKPEHAAAHAALEARWQTLNVIPLPQPAPELPAAEAEQAEPAAPARPVRTRPPLDRDAVRVLLDTLEQAIEQGLLVDADAAAKRIKTALTGHNLPGALESRLQQLQAQLETLRGWARWGTEQARDKLIAAAEELLKFDGDVDALALAIPKLREEWKHLNAHAAAAKAQWERFDALLEKAYQPVAAQRAETAARQAEIRAAKEALCAEWEAEVAGIAWEQADYKLIEARRTAMQKQWREAPQTGFRDERPLRKRFDTLIGNLDRHLEAARASERERREQLIAAAEALAAQPELGRAMSEAKALQERWNQPVISVRLKRQDEEQLWQRFRAACNGIFERRDAARAEQNAQRQAVAETRQTLLAAFAAVVATPLASDADADALRQALARFRSDWDAGKPSGRDATDKLEAQARDLQQQAQQKLDALRNEKYRARFDLMAQKAALAERVEAAAVVSAPLDETLAAAKAAWDALPPLAAKSENPLAKRFAAASQVTQAALAAGHAARADLLLDLEIDLGLPSPASCTDIRRARQLARLQNRFGSASPQAAETESLLARWYGMAALPDATFEARVAAVVRQCLAQTAAAREG